jgi:hypothetical protein
VIANDFNSPDNWTSAGTLQRHKQHEWSTTLR